VSLENQQNPLKIISSDLIEVNNFIKSQLSSEIPLIEEIANHIINSGGKRIRPGLVLLMANSLGYEGSSHYKIAAIIEFIHTATLLHDDVVDGSTLRRGNHSANALFGNAASVLVGDFVYSRAFQIMVSVNNMRIMQILADATNIISEGEVQQLLNMHDPNITEEKYLSVIYSKTAKLFEAATELGSLITGVSNEESIAAAKYGKSLGVAFQLIDDILDYSGKPQDIGKNIGDDLREGKPTLPLIYLLEHGTKSQKNLVQSSISKGSDKNFEAILDAIQTSGALKYIHEKAKIESNKARKYLNFLPESSFKEALLNLTKFAVERKF
tara:strand:+ start:627 stop:1604 length:978 start_codon:yes stop_codon:yes gene_type:complete